MLKIKQLFTIFSLILISFTTNATDNSVFGVSFDNNVNPKTSIFDIQESNEYTRVYTVGVVENPYFDLAKVHTDNNLKPHLISFSNQFNSENLADSFLNEVLFILKNKYNGLENKQKEIVDMEMNQDGLHHYNHIYLYDTKNKIISLSKKTNSINNIEIRLSYKIKVNNAEHYKKLF